MATNGFNGPLLPDAMELVGLGNAGGWGELGDSEGIPIVKPGFSGGRVHIPISPGSNIDTAGLEIL